MKSGLKSFFDDPALAIMGLVPGRYALADGPVGDGSITTAWRAAWGVFAVSFAAVIALFWPTASQIVQVWYSSASFNHGFLILPICGYLIWLKRGLVASLAPRPSLAGIGVILAAGLCWLLGYAGSVSMVQQFALVAMLQGLVLAIFGVAVTRVLLFPLGYMLFAVPFGQFMIPPLQDLTAVFVVKGLQIVGIPVFLDGIFLSIPTGNFEVAEACSGARFLIATIALGTLFAHITYRSRVRQATFVLLCFIVPIIANGFRAFGIVLLAYYSNNKIAVGVDHIVYGWVFFSFITVVLLLLGMMFRDGGMLEIVPDVEALRRADMRTVTQRRVGAVAIAAVLASAVAPAYASRLSAKPVPPAPQALPVPAAGNGWHETGVRQTGWSPRYPDAPVTLFRQFAKGRDRVELFIAYYTSQQHGAELIHLKNQIADFRVWGRAASSMAAARIGDEERTVERSRLVHRGWSNRIVYRWYWIGGRYTASPYVAKFYQALHRLLPGDEAAAGIIVSAAYDEVPADADRVIQDFLRSVPPIAPLLQRAAENR